MQAFYSLEEVFYLESPLSAVANSLVRAVGHICGVWCNLASGRVELVALVPSGCAAKPGRLPCMIVCVLWLARTVGIGGVLL